VSTTVTLADVYAVLCEIRDALRQSPPLAAVPYEQLAGMMGATAQPAQAWTPAPGKAGPAWCYPNPANTPGVPNPNITQDNIATTLAVPGFTATIRPPVSATRIIKQHIMTRDGLTGDPSKWELDHFISLELAGAPLEIGNLWCQPYAPAGTGAHEKDRVENFLHRQIISGALTIVQAQKLITDDWFAVYLSLNKMGLLPMMVAFDPDGSSDPDDNA
jgi:hypothetical protein